MIPVVPYELIPVVVIGLYILLFGPIVFLLDKWTTYKKNDIQVNATTFIVINILICLVLYVFNTNGFMEQISWAPTAWIIINALFLGAFVIYKLTEPKA